MYGLDQADPRSVPVTPTRGLERDAALQSGSGGAGALQIVTSASGRAGTGVTSIPAVVPRRGPPSWALLPRRFPMGARSLALLRDPGLSLATIRGDDRSQRREEIEENPLEETVREATATRAEAEEKLNGILGGSVVPVQGLDLSPQVRVTTRRAQRRRRRPRQQCLAPDTHRSSLPAGRLGAVCVRFSPCGRLLAVACAGRDTKGSSQAQPRQGPGPGGAMGVVEPGGLAEVHHVRIYDLVTADVIAAQGDPEDRVEWEDDAPPGMDDDGDDDDDIAGGAGRGRGRQSTGGRAARARARARRNVSGGTGGDGEGRTVGGAVPGGAARVSPGRYDGAVLLGHTGLVHDMKWWPGVGAGAAQGAEPARGMGSVLSPRTSPWHWLLTASADGTCRLWMVPTDAPMDAQLNRAVRAANGRPDAPSPGPRAGEFTKGLASRAPALAAVLQTVPPSLCYTVAFHPANPRAVLVGTGDGHLQVWDTGVPVAGAPEPGNKGGMAGAAGEYTRRPRLGNGGDDGDGLDEDDGFESSEDEDGDGDGDGVGVGSSFLGAGDRGKGGGSNAATPRGHWGEAMNGEDANGGEQDEDEEARRRE